MKDILDDKEDLNNILTQQILISQLANGISYGDTEDMDEYERIFILNKLIELKKEENRVKQESIEKMKRT